jgi:UDP-N-acetylglucosamine--N-acetylmuramyl-(pentapeptide) pyrophosphoryl-undecaprenol N-acetylglucosamine transferase
LGSRRINETLVAALRLMGTGDGMREIQVLHVTGGRSPAELDAGEAALIAPRYRAVAYLEDDYPAALAAADLVVSRAGASTLAELTARGLPSVLVPWSGATTGEQALNAEPLARAGAAVVIPDARLGPECLAEALGGLLREDAKREAMARASASLGHPKAAEAVAAAALALAERKRGA